MMTSKEDKNAVQHNEIDIEDGAGNGIVPDPLHKRCVSHIYNLKVNGVLTVVCRNCFWQIGITNMLYVGFVHY